MSAIKDKAVTDMDATPGCEVVYRSGEIVVTFEPGFGRMPGQFAARVAGDPVGWGRTLSEAVSIAQKRARVRAEARAAMAAVPEFTATERAAGVKLAVVIFPDDLGLVAEVGRNYVRQMPARERAGLWGEVSLRFAAARFAFIGTKPPTGAQVAARVREPWGVVDA